MEYIFRKASIQDFKEISALYRQAIAYMTEAGILQWDEVYPDDEVLLQDILQEDMYLLTAEAGRLISCVVINEDQGEQYLTGSWKYTEGRVAVIHRLCVRPDAQGVGVGRKTVQLAETEASDYGYDLIRLDAFAQNKAALKLYEGLGYSYAGQVQFRKGIFYLMEKKMP
jgi:ribosomal protein S18 acetylase RimI-like enzyme